MNNQSSNRVSLKKEQNKSWTDPVTGEIYPGGNPNEVPYSQQNIPQPQPFPQQSSYIPNNVEVYPGQNNVQPAQNALQPGMKFCKFCGEQIPMDAVICVKCGRQVEQLQGMPNANQQVFINQPAPIVYHTGTPKNKWVAFALCFFLGTFGAHRFYEGKIGTGLLWLFTFGLLGIGWLVDWITILTKPETYYV